MRILCFVITLLIFASCSSLVYSPSVGISSDNLKEKQVDLSGGFGLLPETQPHLNEETTTGAFLKVGYGFTDKFNLHFNVFTAVENGEFFKRRGYSLHSRIAVKSFEKSRFEVIPRAAVLIENNTINGYGASIAGIYVNNFQKKLFFYIGVAPAFGIKEFKKIDGHEPYEKMYPFGWGVIGHAGLGYDIIPRLRAVLEINPILEFNEYDNQNNYLISPSLTVGYLFE